MKAMSKSANFKGENLKRLLSGARKLMNSSITMVLPGMDSNHDKRLQRPLSYRWTTRQRYFQFRFTIFNQSLIEFNINYKLFDD